ncbi:MAG: AraC family transcriptional regulator [Bacilli bacterium]|nr:AraC family transcriptional regulator [Bacilli bacterium]MBN2696149.1 AraC family transcriptional regulator [Bacilli bacterium]
MDKTLRPYVRFAMHHTFIREYFIERHIWDHEIIFIEKGKMKFTIDNEVYIAEENDCVFLRPDVLHKIEWAGEDCEQPHVHFDFFVEENSDEVRVSLFRKDEMTPKERTWFREDFFKANKIDLPYVFKLKEPFIIRDLLFRLIDEYEHKLPFSGYMLQGLLLELLSAVLRDYRLGKAENSHPYAKELDNLVRYMSEHVDQNLTLDDLTDFSSFSKWNLIHVFKSYYNMTPMKYFNHLKYNRAKNLLLYSHMTVKEITYKMHFDSPQTFSRWFKNQDGKSPIFYRRRRSD